MSEKRYYLKSVCGDEGLYDKENGCIIINKNSLLDLDENWNTIVDLLNEQDEEIKELEEENEHYKNSKYGNLVTAIVKTCNDLAKEDIYLADFDICKRITEYEMELNNE